MENGVRLAEPPSSIKLPKINTCGPGAVGHPPLHRPAQPYSGLSGPSYSISGHQEKFKLPPGRVLQPGVEQQSGKLDSWPVHPIRPAPSNLSIGQQSSSAPQGVPVTGHHASPSRMPLATTIIPKPKFLEQLEAYLQKELRLLGCPPVGPHELRLQAHREVFEYLIEDFRTYKPLLSAIKNEYDLFVSHQQDLIRELMPMRAQLEAVREECERRIMALKEEERGEEAAVELENRRLTGRIEQMKLEELSYKAQIEKLQDEIAQLYEKYRNEADARKLLISDYNDLKYRQLEQKSSEESGQEEREDPVILKLKLTRAREDLRAANQRINTMLADYGDVVPRREFEMLETSYKTLEAELDTVKNDHETLMVEHSTLQSMSRDTQAQRDKMADELTRLKRSATPRPDWSRCANYVEGGTPRWAELSDGRSSDQMVDVLLAQIAGVDVSEIVRDDTFQGQGVGEDVPHHLRADGPVRNRKIGRAEVNELVSGFWQHRLTSEETSQPVSESLYSYLLSRNDSDEPLAVEDGYNLEEACTRFAHEPHVALFAQILSGEVEEGVFNHWLETQTAITEVFSQQQEDKGVVSQPVLEQVLASKLPAKSQANMRALVNCALEMPPPKPGKVDYFKLMSPDSEGQPSPFVLLLLEQSRAECKEFVRELTVALGSKSEVSLGEVRSAVQALDPSMPAQELYSILARGFSLAIAQVGEASEAIVPVAQLVERLEAGAPLRTSPKH